MSVEAMSWALKQEPASAVDKLVLVALGNFADDKHQCFPSRKTVAGMAMCSIDTVDRALARLCESGLVSKEARPGLRGGLTSNCYTLAVPTDPKPQPAPSRNMRPPQPQRAATLAAPVPLPSPHGCGHPSRNAAATYEPLLEPSNEPSNETVHALRAEHIGKSLKKIGRDKPTRMARLQAKAEGLGLPVDELTAETTKRAKSSPEGYFKTRCVTLLQSKLPRVSEAVLADAIEGKSQAYTLVMVALSGLAA